MREKLPGLAKTAIMIGLIYWICLIAACDARGDLMGDFVDHHFAHEEIEIEESWEDSWEYTWEDQWDGWTWIGTEYDEDWFYDHDEHDCTVPEPLAVSSILIGGALLLLLRERK